MTPNSGGTTFSESVQDGREAVGRSRSGPHVRHVWLWAGLVGAALASSPAAQACQCGAAPDPRRAFAASPYVLEVQIASQWASWYRDRQFGSLDLARTFDGSVERVLKGPRFSRVRFADAEGNCSYSFEPGKTYLVYARPNPHRTGFLESTVCDPTREVSAAGDQYSLLGVQPHRATPATRESTAHKAARRLTTSFLAGTVRLAELAETIFKAHPVQVVWFRFALLLAAPAAALAAWRYRRKVRLALAIGAGAAAVALLAITAAGWHSISSSPLASQWFR